MDIFAEDAFDNCREYIVGFYSGKRENLDREYPLLNATRIDRFVAETAEAVAGRIKAIMEGWKVRSNAESGDGYSDIIVEVEDERIGIVIEIKYAENARFDIACQNAMKQIHDNHYEEGLIDDGMETIYRYEIACYKKRCQVVSE